MNFKSALVQCTLYSVQIGIFKKVTFDNYDAY